MADYRDLEGDLDSGKTLGPGGLDQQVDADLPQELPFAGFSKPVIQRIYQDVAAVPTSLYHYTSSAGLIGIITNHKLWFSDAAFMNDGSEVTYGYQALSLAIDEFMGDKTEPEKDAGEALKQEVAQALTHFQPIIFCMSARNNLLSQWRDYGRDIVPYCIEFDTNELERWNERQCNFPIFLTKVVYDASLQRSLLLELLNSIYKKAKSLLGERDFFDDAEAKPLLVSAAIELVALINRFKNPAFDSEEEWRAISYRPDVERSVQRKYRASSLGAVPYYEWYSLAERGNLPIKSVTVGPSPYARVSDLALKQLLTDYGYSDTTQFSTIPLRR